MTRAWRDRGTAVNKIATISPARISAAGMEADALHGLIARIYDTATDQSRWPAVLAETRDYVGGNAANLYAKRGWRLVRGFYRDDGGISDHYKSIYTERFVPYDPATPAELNAGIDEPVSTADVSNIAEYHDSRFYQEWQQPQQIVDFICTPIEKTAERTALFCIFRHQRDGMADDGALARMRLIAPHIRRAALISQLLEQQMAQAAQFRHALDGLDAGLFLVDARNRVVHANRAAEDMLGEAVAITARNGRLGTVDTRATKILQAASEAAGNGDAALGQQAIAVPIEARDGSHFAAHLLPLTSGDRRDTGSDLQATAAVFVKPTTVAIPTGAELVAKAFGLTPGEQRALARIVEVGGVAEAADALGVSETTVKTHLHHIFAKTGMQRQPDLVRLVAGFSSPLKQH
jgi:DNA-binding CsgD family transcriptional regulator/PAS domain-containing protein